MASCSHCDDSVVRDNQGDIIMDDASVALDGQGDVVMGEGHESTSEESVATQLAQLSLDGT